MDTYLIIFSFQCFLLCFNLDSLPLDQQYKCGNEFDCQNPGPYLAGIDEAACSSQGGTFCALPPDCTILRDCVQDYITEAGESSVFGTYLKAAPEIKNPNDLRDCGRAREYFGFEESFINDKQICEDVKQLQYTKDFEFLNDFFGNGPVSTLTPGGLLSPPDRSTFRVDVRVITLFLSTSNLSLTRPSLFLRRKLQYGGSRKRSGLAGHQFLS